jgi:hypothetical protein
MDVGIWTKKKLKLVKKSEIINDSEDNEYESHWLRFERQMENHRFANTSDTGKFILTDIDFLMGGNTFFKWNDFEFR